MKVFRRILYLLETCVFQSQFTEVIFQEMFVHLNYNLEHCASIFCEKITIRALLRGHCPTLSNISFSTY